MLDKITKRCKCNNPNWVVVSGDSYQVKCIKGIMRSVGFIGSKYSTVMCLNCGDSWRTKAKYVDELKDIRDVTCTEEYLNKVGR